MSYDKNKKFRLKIAQLMLRSLKKSYDESLTEHGRLEVKDTLRKYAEVYCNGDVHKLRPSESE